MRLLTWYPGTLLPHTSLWYTLLRATWLNSLKAGDICTVAGGRRKHQSIEPHDYSEGCEDAVELVAKSIGEPLREFSRFSRFEQIPAWLFPHAAVRFLRWCPACLEAGYHSWLMSITLIEKCPIHQIPLVMKCPGCGNLISTHTRGLVVKCKICSCGKGWNFDPDVIRQPRLCASDVMPWAPVASWLSQARKMCCSSEAAGDSKIQRALIARGCRDLGVAYPECFTQEAALWQETDSSTLWTKYRACSGDLTGIKNITPEYQYSHTSPKICVYRAMARHLRRHGLPNPDRWIAKLIEEYNPMTFAMKMKGEVKRRNAFSEMIWTRTLEPHAYVRRWPTRAAPIFIDGWDHTPLEISNPADIAIRGFTPSNQAYIWLMYHVMAMQALLAWGDAVNQTINSINNLWADWSVTTNAHRTRLVWFSRTIGNKQKIVGYLSDYKAVPFDVNLTSSKNNKSNTFNHCSNINSLPEDCLELSCENKFQICHGFLPERIGDVRLVSLLNAEVQIKCFIYKSAGKFVARLDNGLIQAVGENATIALNGLRNAVCRYQWYDSDNSLCNSLPSPKIKNRPPPEAWLASHAVYSCRGATRFWEINPEYLEMARLSFLRQARQYYN